MRCPSCGQYDEVVIVEHAADDPEHTECMKRHEYCRNCDWGLCCGNC